MEFDLETWFAAEGWLDFVNHVNNLDSAAVAEASGYMTSKGPGILSSLYDSSDDSDFKKSHAADWLRSWFQAFGSRRFAAWEAHNGSCVTESELVELVTLWFKDEGLEHFIDDTEACGDGVAELTRDLVGKYGYTIMSYVLGGHEFDHNIIDFDLCGFKSSSAGIYMIDWFSIVGYALFAQWLGRSGHYDIALAVMVVRTSNIPEWISSVVSKVA